VRRARVRRRASGVPDGRPNHHDGWR
jgi:hypothetical protein